MSTSRPPHAPSVSSGPSVLSTQALAAAGLLISATAMVAAPARALDAPGPVVCTTTLEAPTAGSMGISGPVEVTRCGVVRTTPELVTDRYYTWRAPFARGVSVVNQLADLFGVAMGGGREGNRVMGLGFPDQAITWDGTAVENTSAWLLQNQSPDLPLRTADLPSIYGGSIANPSRSATCPSPDRAGCASPASSYQGGSTSYYQPVRGLW
jgi:hypothetical protein